MFEPINEYFVFNIDLATRSECSASSFEVLATFVGTKLETIAIEKKQFLTKRDEATVVVVFTL